MDEKWRGPDRKEYDDFSQVHRFTDAALADRKTWVVHLRAGGLLAPTLFERAALLLSRSIRFRIVDRGTRPITPT
jgi:hypothetical protein